MQWIDSTSYRRDRTGQVANTFSAKCGLIRLTVVYGHIDYPGRWIGSALPLFKEKELSATTHEEAQSELVRLVHEWLDTAVSALEDIQ